MVFDGAGEPGAREASAHAGGVEVLFAPSGVDADTLVEALARGAREAGTDAIVVTSDASTQWTVLGRGVGLMSAREFVEVLADDVAERAEHLGSGPGKATVGQGIDDATRSALLRIRDS